MPDFVHLHIHSEFSLLDGANRIKDIPVIAKELGIPVCIYSENNSAKADALEAGAMLYEIKPSFSSFSSSR